MPSLVPLRRGMRDRGRADDIIPTRVPPASPRRPPGGSGGEGRQCRSVIVCRMGVVSPGPDLAVLLATSGHSGVDRVMGNLVPGLAAAGLTVDLLGIEGHGPHWGPLPPGIRRLPLGSRHVYSALPALVRYLRLERPRALLADKDRINRVALIGRWLADVDTRVYLRSGTTISVDLASRRWLDRAAQTLSMRRLYRFADGVLVPSLGAARDLVAYARLPPGQVRVVPSPVVTPDLPARAGGSAPHRWLGPGMPPVILGVGELCGRKDFATLLRAHARLRQRVDCRLLILGEGRQREALESLAGELGSAAEVDLPGWVSNPYPYLARARAFALTSRWEGMPVVLIEALAVGVPVVATDCPSGPAEILDRGRVGPLVPVGDDAALADALETLLRQPPRREDLTAAALPYTVVRSVEAYLRAMDFVDSALQSAAAGGGETRG